MRIAFGLAVLALAFIGLVWAWWSVTGRTRRGARIMRRAPQVMIDIALADAACDAATRSGGTRR